MINIKDYWGNIITSISDVEREFVDYIEHLARESMKKAEMELTKAKECQAMLELPSRKENWDAQESAEDSLDDHMSKVFSYLKELAVLTRGLEVFKDGLIYNALKSTSKLKNKVEIE